MATVAGFLTFIRNVMGVNALYLPDADPTIGYAFQIASATVNPMIASMSIPPLPGQSPSEGWGSMYDIAVYNLGGSLLINYAQDQPGRDYFTKARATFSINQFSSGVNASASDSGTSTSNLNPEFMKRLTLQDLQTLKDPYGRRYLMIAQSTGTLWGLS